MVGEVSIRERPMETTRIIQYRNALVRSVHSWVMRGKDPEKRRDGASCLLADLDFTEQHCEDEDTVSALNALRSAFRGALELRIIPRIGRVILR